MKNSYGQTVESASGEHQHSEAYAHGETFAKHRTYD
jgi:hypothetical protein